MARVPCKTWRSSCKTGRGLVSGTAAPWICDSSKTPTTMWQCCRSPLLCVPVLGITAFVALAWMQFAKFPTMEVHLIQKGGCQRLSGQIMSARTGAYHAQAENLTRTNDELSVGVLRQRASIQELRQRGVGLLHSLTDDELFKKAISVENAWSSESVSTPPSPKIAFLFLTQRDVPFAPFWNKFFAGHEGMYNIYVHMWPLRLNAIQKNKGVFWGRLVPSEEGKRLTPGLITVARRMLANALLDDASNEWFAVVSDSCVPLYGFPHVYKTLASTNRTFMEMSATHWDRDNRYKARGDDVMEPEIPFSQFRYGSQFWVMRRRHAVMTVRDTKYWDKFNRPCLAQYANCYPEEHYFPTLLNILEPSGTTNYSATLVDWTHNVLFNGHPRTFNSSEISPEFIKDLRKWKNGHFLFARKFDSGCLEPLLQFADVILNR